MIFSLKKTSCIQKTGENYEEGGRVVLGGGRSGSWRDLGLGGSGSHDFIDIDVKLCRQKE